MGNLKTLNTGLLVKPIKTKLGRVLYNKARPPGGMPIPAAGGGGPVAPRGGMTPGGRNPETKNNVLVTCTILLIKQNIDPDNSLNNIVSLVLQYLVASAWG